ncbi:hypothetical protein [Bradyrhizobium japonicum]|uniref:hypothetical protein n=1 Tax=Bradyrhizobium japonicum TaxID=375 RepID=UPI001E6507F4|nr:hypothetical protein [Bradyrhizobium japonicum]MCD9825240.1 hypothetical protein [Bradyrhizobium japonicum]MCD9898117.1 hypothetical protein [Bradyrhizobium japonicum]MEB2671251.1 hypothetical protein [Bradyrhizobium japonicum]WLB28486.1 hypothetical protein QIH85_42925 [Bradyrhizobium japonicum]WRI90565.1 hypothetical protein R3F75_06475 [Bradyrhizobium japonicum]
MHHANDNQPLGADAVIEQRPSPDELNRILHRRFPGMGPAYGRQLDEAARRTFNADMSKWLGLDNRWHPCGEQYRQPKGSRRLAKPSKPARPALLYRDQDVGAPYHLYESTVAEGAEFLAGKTTPSVGGRQIRFDAAEDAMIALIDARRAPPQAANDNEPAGRRRRSRRKLFAKAA